MIIINTIGILYGYHVDNRGIYNSNMTVSIPDYTRVTTLAVTRIYYCIIILYNAIKARVVHLYLGIKFTLLTFSPRARLRFSAVSSYYNTHVHRI